MKKVDLAQVIAMLANVGVIAGIIFLGYELHQNNEQLAADSRFNYYQTRVNFFRENATDEEFAELCGLPDFFGPLITGEWLRC